VRHANQLPQHIEGLIVRRKAEKPALGRAQDPSRSGLVERLYRVAHFHGDRHSRKWGYKPRGTKSPSRRGSSAVALLPPRATTINCFKYEISAFHPSTAC
jgi:hypothetical protein